MSQRPESNKKKSLFFLVGLYLFLLYAFLHKSANPSIGPWSHLYFFGLIFCTGLVFLCTYLYFSFEKLGRGYCFFLIIFYFSALFIIDFAIGSYNFILHDNEIHHPVYHHQPRPGIHRLAVDDQASFDHRFIVSINSQGLRSQKEIPFEKPADIYRILVLGDSFAAGDGVNDEETFCHLVNTQLNRIPNRKVTYEVLNAGVESYVPLLESLYLKNKGMKFQPDFVLVFFDMSDLIQTQEYLKRAEYDSNGEVVRVRPPDFSAIERFDIFMKTRFYFLTFVYKSLANKISARNTEQLEAIGQSTDRLLEFTLSEDQTPWAKEWERIFVDIEAMHSLCQERNIKFAVGIYPWGHQVNNYEWDHGREEFGIPKDYTAPLAAADMMAAKLGSQDISVLNLFPVFRGYRGEDLLYFHQDMHWRKEGHALAAEHIAEFLGSRILGNK